MYFSLCMFFLLLLPVKSEYVGDSCLADELPGTYTLISKCQHLLDEIASVGKPLPKHLSMKLSARTCGFVQNEPVVCCTPSSDLTETRYDIPDIPDIQNHRNLRLLPTRTCGVSDSVRVLGGSRTDLLDMPFMVLLSYDSPRGRMSKCGGTLINEWYVLTAAHCVTGLKKKKLDRVILGEWDTKKDPDCEGVGDDYYCVPSAKNVTVEAVIVHKLYNQPTKHINDIALLRLSEPADFSSARIKPVCLPVTKQLQNEDLVGQESVITGWGADDNGMQSTILLYAEIPIVGNKQCQDAHKGSSFAPGDKTPVKIYSSQICAGGIMNKDSCAGDSGGPLLVFGNVAGTKGTRYVQRGIVSYGSRTCGTGLPSVYTRTAYYMDWILDNIQE